MGLVELERFGLFTDVGLLGQSRFREGWYDKVLGKAEDGNTGFTVWLGGERSSERKRRANILHSDWGAAALDLGRGENPKSYIVEEIWQELAKAKYREWEQASTERSWELQTLKEACEAALEQKYFLDQSELEGFVDEAEIAHRKQLKSLRSVFEKVAEADSPSEVPDYLCCKITLDILRDPVITPSGVTYERAVILDHFNKVGNFDPITRELLDESQLIPNLAIKEAVQSFLDKHGWAYNTE
ncbi:E3 ubiquitin-protein ligase CHIP [Cucumis melo var. makuwa]|nr:E3 ubiquitin-protein ligase CHIP [Cucumis melo var. makuwa]